MFEILGLSDEYGSGLRASRLRRVRRQGLYGKIQKHLGNPPMDRTTAFGY